MAARDAIGGVDENHDGGTEGPGHTEVADAGSAVSVGLALVADDGGEADVEEHERGHELGDGGAVQGPRGQLARVKKWGRGRLTVWLLFLGQVGGATEGQHLFGHGHMVQLVNQRGCQTKYLHIYTSIDELILRTLSNCLAK